MLAALLTVGPVDRAVLISTAAFAVGLPPEVGAFVLLRLVRDLESTKIEDVVLQTLTEAGLDSHLPAAASGSRRERRAASALGVSYALLVVGIMSALVGLTATLWHMGWWIAVAFVAAVVVSQIIAFPVIARSSRVVRSTTEAAPPATGAQP